MRRLREPPAVFGHPGGGYGEDRDGLFTGVHGGRETMDINSSKRGSEYMENFFTVREVK